MRPGKSVRLVLPLWSDFRVAGFIFKKVSTMTNLVEFDFREMVSVSGDEVVTTSQQIAKFFKREHKNILRAIEKLECSAEFARLNYELCFENNELQNGKPNKFYRMTKDGMIFLVMGFTGKTAAGIKEKYILGNSIKEQPKTLADAYGYYFVAGVSRYELSQILPITVN